MFVIVYFDRSAQVTVEREQQRQCGGAGNKLYQNTLTHKVRQKERF